MTALIWPAKDPQEVLDYEIDWTDRLAGDAIFSSTWTRTGDDSALIIDSNSHDDTKATVWLSAGTLGKSYQLLNRVVTDGGRTMDQTVEIVVSSK